MIRNRIALSMVEAEEYTKDNDNSAELNKFIKKFAKMDLKKAKALREKLELLGFMKMKSEHISKIIDILPETDEDLNKIFIDINLDENEIQQILGAVKEFIK